MNKENISLIYRIKNIHNYFRVQERNASFSKKWKLYNCIVHLHVIFVNEFDCFSFSQASNRIFLIYQQDRK